MSVVGSWSEEEIKASYALGNDAIWITLSIVLFAVTLSAMIGGKRKRQLLCRIGWASATVSFYVCLVQGLAKFLCVDAPLNIKATGVLYLPFFLGTNGAGFFYLGIFVATINVLTLALSCKHEGLVLSAAFVNSGLMVILALAALFSYVAACMGIGTALL